MNFRIEEDIAIFEFDDGKVNSIGHELIEQFFWVLDEAESKASALLILGRDGLFSAGFDLKEIEKGRNKANLLVNKGSQLFYRLFDFPKPLVAGCSGHAVAAGAFLLLSCDYRVGSSGNFKIGLNETAIGMAPLPLFGSELASNRLSQRFLTRAIIQSEMFSPEDAVEVGFLDEVVGPKDLFDSVKAKALELSSLPAVTYGKMKRHSRAATLERIKKSFKA